MEEKASSNRNTPPSELAAAEAMASGGAQPPQDPEEVRDDVRDEVPRACPNCGRSIEPGFRFCDGCGTKVDSESAPSGAQPAAQTPEPAPPVPNAAPVSVPPVEEQRTGPLERWLRRREERSALGAVGRTLSKAPPGLEDATEVGGGPPVAASSEATAGQADDTSTATTSEDAAIDASQQKESSPLLERWRRRRADRSALGRAERALADGSQNLEAPADVTAPAQQRAPGATSKPKTAEELHGARPLIGGRLQWAPEDTDTTADTSEATAPQPTWRPVPIPEAAPERAGGGEAPRFVLHFLIAFMAGGIALLALAALASVVSDGRVSLLESRGLPIFIGGAVSIVVFALLRTSESKRSDPARTRRGVILGVVAGLLGLVVLAAVLYRPAVAGRLQPRIERVLRVFSTEDERAVEQFERSVIEWNQAAEDYHDSLEVALREREDPDRLRGSAAQAETTLEGVNSQMRTSAESAQQPELRDALSDLASIYEDQLGGLRVVNRGLLVDNIDLVRTGDASFKDAHERATTLFQSRLRPLLLRAGLDAQSFGNAIAG